MLTLGLLELNGTIKTNQNLIAPAVLSLFVQNLISKDLSQKIQRSKNLSQALDLFSPNETIELKIALGGESSYRVLKKMDQVSISDLMNLAHNYQKQGLNSQALVLSQLMINHCSLTYEENRFVQGIQKASMGQTSHLSMSDKIQNAASQFLEDALEPETILNFTLAGMAFRWTKLKVLKTFSKANPVSMGGLFYLNRGPMALWNARSIAFVAEVSTFTAMNLQSQYRAGQSISWENTQDLFALNAITLFALKASYWSGSKLYSGSPWGQKLFSNASAVAGLTLGHTLAARANLMPQMAWSENLLQSVISQTHLLAGGFLAKVALGKKHARQMKQQALATQRQSSWLVQGPLGGSGSLAWAGKAGLQNIGKPLRENATTAEISQTQNNVFFKKGVSDGELPQWPEKVRAFWDEYVGRIRWKENNFRLQTAEPQKIQLQSPYGVLSIGETLQVLSQRIFSDTEIITIDILGPRVKVCKYYHDMDPKNKARLLGERMSTYVQFLQDHEQLEGINFRFMDGKVLYFYRKINKDREYDVGFDAKKDVHLFAYDEIEYDYDNIKDVAARYFGMGAVRKRVFKLRLDPIGKKFKGRAIPVTIHRVLRESRLHRDMSLAQVQQILRGDFGIYLEMESLKRYERSAEVGMPYQTLYALAQIYRANLIRYIESYNYTLWRRSKYAGIDQLTPQDWQAWDYPIFIESAQDVKKLLEFRDPKSRSQLGWLVFSKRKYPWAYHSVAEIAEAARLGVDKITHIEFEKGETSVRETLLSLQGVLNLALFELIDANNQSHFRAFVPLLNHVFPGLAFYLDPKGNTERYLNHWAAVIGKISHLMVALRRSTPYLDDVHTQLHLKAQESDSEFSVDWKERENGNVGFSVHNRWQWQAFFRKMGLDLGLLDYYYREHGLAPESSQVILADVIGSRNFSDFYHLAGVLQRVVTDVLAGKRRTKFPAAVKLAQVIPLGKRGLFLVGLFPVLAEVFPELSQNEKPYLNVNENLVQEAFASFHVGEFLLAYKLKQKMNSREMGAILGVSERLAYRMVSQTGRIHNASVLDRLAQLYADESEVPLAYARKVIYLYNFPELVDLFPLAAPIENINFLKASHQKKVSFDNLRGELRAEMVAQGLTNHQDLAEFLGVDEKQAKRILSLDTTLNSQDIRILSDRFPNISYVKWYEHFNRSRLAYYIGLRSDGGINYFGLAHFTRGEKAVQDVFDLIDQKIKLKFGDYEQAALVSQVKSLKNAATLKRRLTARTWQDEMIESVVDELDFNFSQRRRLFFFMNEDEINRVIRPENK